MATRKSTQKLPNPPLDEPTDPVLPSAVLPPRNMREEILEVYQRLGGAEAMITWAKSNTANERLFYSQILPKVIPREVNTNLGDGKGGAAKLVVQWETPSIGPVAQLTGVLASITQEAIDE